LVYDTAARCSPKVFYTYSEINVFYIVRWFLSGQRAGISSGLRLHYLTSVKGSLPTAQQIFNLQGGPSGIERLRKGAAPAMDRGRDPPSGGSGVLVPWTLDSRKKKLQCQSKGKGAPWCRCPKSAHVCIPSMASERCFWTWAVCLCPGHWTPAKKAPEPIEGQGCPLVPVSEECARVYTFNGLREVFLDIASATSRCALGPGSACGRACVLCADCPALCPGSTCGKRCSLSAVCPARCSVSACGKRCSLKPNGRAVLCLHVQMPPKHPQPPFCGTSPRG
jgi:hypothetical protein